MTFPNKSWVGLLLVHLHDFKIIGSHNGKGTGWIEEIDGQALSPPILVLVTEDALRSYLENSREDAAVAIGSSDDPEDLTDALRLLSINLWETLATRVVAKITITATDVEYETGLSYLGLDENDD